jgi:hypothetical protein
MIQTLRLCSIFFFVIFAGGTIFAQTGQKPTTGHLADTSKKQVKSNNDNGKLLPRVALTGINDNTSIKGTSTNTLVYNTSTTGEGKNKIFPGYYHNVGTTEKPEWKRIEVTVSDAVKNK